MFFCGYTLHGIVYYCYNPKKRVYRVQQLVTWALPLKTFFVI